MIKDNTTKGIIFSSISALSWGFLAIALKVSLDELRPLDVSWTRFAVAFVTLSIFYLFRNRKAFAIILKAPLFLIFAAIFLGFNYLGFIAGLNYTTPAVSQIFIQTGPVLLALAGFMIYKEKVNFRQSIGLIVVVLGLLLFYNEQLTVIASSKNVFNKGVLFVLGGGASWALYASFQKPLVKKFTPMHLNLVIFGLPALFFLPFIDFGGFAKLTAWYYVLLFCLGLNTVIAYGALAYALKYLEATKISVILTLNPIITFAGMAFLAYIEVSWIDPESFTLLTIFGALLVIIGAVLTVMKKNK